MTAVVSNYSDLKPRMWELLTAAAARPGGEFRTLYASSLAALCRRGLTEDLGAGCYRLTDKGATAAKQFRPAAEASPDARLYDAIRDASPALTSVARYVAQLRRWATETLPGDNWEAGRKSAFILVADQLERNVLHDLAPLLLPEAARRDAEAVTNLSAIDHTVLSVYDEVDSGTAVVVRPPEMISDPQAWASSVDRLAARGLVDHERPGGKFLTDAGRAALGHLS